MNAFEERIPVQEREKRSQSFDRKVKHPRCCKLVAGITLSMKQY